MKKKENKLNNIRIDIVSVAKEHIILNGWNDNIVDFIVSKNKFRREVILALFPKGYKSILEFYLSILNDRMTKASQKINLSRMKTHERVKEIILLRLKMNKKDKKLLKKTMFTLMLPQHSKIATLSLYNIVDQIWFIAGDKSTDFNFYTKRAILALIYSSTIFYWLNNDKDFNQTKNFLNKQLEKVSIIPKIKKKLNKASIFLPNFFNLAKEFKQ